MQNQNEKCSHCNGTGMVSDFLGYSESPCHCRRAVPWQAPPLGDYPPLPMPAHRPYIDDNGNVLAHGGYSAEQLMLYVATDRAERKAAPDQLRGAANMIGAEPMTRYCPGCGSVGPVDYTKHRDCCPDGGQARMIPAALAQKCRDTFQIAVAGLQAEPAAVSVADLAAAPGTPPMTPDEARWAARSADRMRGPSDVTSGTEYAMAGAMALAKKLAAAPQAPAAPCGDERTAFEAWIKKDGGDLSTFGSGQNRHYNNSAVNNAWTGWSSRAAMAAPAEPASKRIGQIVNPASEQSQDMGTVVVAEIMSNGYNGQVLWKGTVPPVGTLLYAAPQAAPAAPAAVPDEREASIRYDVLHEFATKHRVDYNELCTTARAALAATPEVQAELHEIAIEELSQLGYTFDGSKMRPPEYVGELMAVVQASPCGCREGECETKANRACRMTAEIAATAKAEVQQVGSYVTPSGELKPDVQVQADKCLCTFSQRVVGDGCRYCNPQEYIDMLIEQIVDSQKEVQAEPVANCHSDDDGDSWRDSPVDFDFVDGLELGDVFELQASIRSWPETFRVTKVPDETSDDYEVEPVSVRTAPQATQPSDADAEINDALTEVAAAIRERDEVEEFADKVLDLVLGADRTEWASSYGKNDALLQVEEKMAAMERAQPAKAEAQATQPPCAWAISYDGKIPYTLWHEGDGALLDTEIKRLGGSACKMPLYTTQPQAPAAPDLRRENANLYEALAWWRRDAKIRGEAARLLMENLSDEDRFGDGRINTTRVRELMEPITRDTDEQPRDLGESPEVAPAAPAWADQAVIEYQYTGGTHWCPLGPAERMKPGFDGVYRLQPGSFPTVEAPAAPAVDAETIHLQDLKNALADCKALRQQLTLMDEQQAGSVWRWQADGQDQLESMGNHMGVLILACDLRALLAGVSAPAVDAPITVEAFGRAVRMALREHLERKPPRYLNSDQAAADASDHAVDLQECYAAAIAAQGKEGGTA